MKSKKVSPINQFPFRMHSLFLFLAFLLGYNSEAWGDHPSKPQIFGKNPPSATCALTILHTGDLHSHFRPGKSHYGLGGYARIKTLVDERRMNRPSLFLDAGDWSEGGLYYVLDAGAASLSMLNLMGYDAAVMGNHDWFNGPAVLENVIKKVTPNFPILGANFDYKKLRDTRPESNLDALIVPYQIFSPEKLGVDLTVGVVGLATDESEYSDMFLPVEIRSPLYHSDVKRIIADVRSRVDVLILLTHLRDEDDEKLATRIPGIDLIIGGHTHHRFPPRELTYQAGTPREWKSFLVKTGEHGEFVGEICLSFDRTKPANKRIEIGYQLHQLDSSLREDPVILAAQHHYDAEIQKKYTDVSPDLFSDHLTDAQIDLLSSEKNESNLGNFIADCIYDAVRNRVGPVIDAAVNTSSFIRTDAIKGPIMGADVFDMLPAIYNSETGKTWKLYTIRLRGELLKNLLGEIMSYDRMIDLSHGYVHYDDENKEVLDLSLGGLAFAPAHLYTLAASEGVITALESPRALAAHPELRDITTAARETGDTGLELWKVVRDALRAIGPRGVTSAVASVEGRVRTLQPDVAIFPHYFDLVFDHDSQEADLDLVVTNFGLQPASGMVNFYFDTTPKDATDNPTRLDVVELLHNRFLPEKIGSYKRLSVVDFSGVAPLGSQQLRLPSVELPLCEEKTCHLTAVVSNVLDDSSGTDEVLLENNIAEFFYR